MNTLSYHIVIKTHAGYRVGDLSVNINMDGEQVSGRIQAPFFEPQFYGVMRDDSTLLLHLTVSAEGKQEKCECTGRISVYAIHISVPATEFTYEIDGTSAKAKVN